MPLVLGPLLVGLLPLLAALVLLGLSQASTAQHGSANSGTFWDFITGRVYFHKIAGFAAQFARWVVSHFAAGQLVMVARFLGSMAALASGLLSANPAALEELVQAVERVWHRGDPKARSAAHKAGSAAAKAATGAHHANVRAGSVGHDLTRYKGRTGTRLQRIERRVEVVLPHEIGQVRSREKALSRDLHKLWKRTRLLEHGAIKTFDWIRTHPLGVAAGAFTGALAAVLSWPAVRALRCNEFGNLYNKRGCGLWNDLDALLATLAVAVGTVSLVEFAREEQKIMGEWAKLVRDLWEV